jgi:hypothetical protein
MATTASTSQTPISTSTGTPGKSHSQTQALGDRENALAMGVGEFMESYERSCSKFNKKGILK